VLYIISILLINTSLAVCWDTLSNAFSRAMADKEIIGTLDHFNYEQQFKALLEKRPSIPVCKAY
jgi:hypothetical protein